MGWSSRGDQLAARYDAAPGFILVSPGQYFLAPMIVAYPYLNTDFPLDTNVLWTIPKIGNFPYGEPVVPD